MSQDGEDDLGRLLVEMVILQSTRSQTDAGVVLKEAAEHYKWIFKPLPLR
jgi:hypothetical protein